MARNGVTYKAVSECAEQLLAVGIQPTVAQVREKIGNGSKTAISRYLDRWREQSHDQTTADQKTQTSRSGQQGMAFDALKHPEASPSAELPEALMVLIRGFWQSLGQSTVSDQVQVANEQTGRSHQEAVAAADEQLREHVELIQEYVGGLERELAETTAMRNRLAERLQALYIQTPTQSTAQQGTAQQNVTQHKVTQHGSAHPVSPAALCEPNLTPSPLIRDLESIFAGLAATTPSSTTDETWGDETAQALDEHLSATAAQGWLDTVSAQDKAASPMLRLACRYLSAALAREQSFEQDNRALLKQMRFLQNKIAERSTVLSS